MSASNAPDKQKSLNPRSSWWALIKQTATEWMDDDAQTWAGAVACYTLLALAPLLVLAVRFLSVFLTGHVPQDQINAQARAWMGSAAGDAITEIVKNAGKPGNGSIATIISLILAVVSVGGIFGELQQAMNRIWKVKAKPANALLAWLWSRAVSVGVVLTAAVLLLGSLAVTTWLEKVTTSLGLTWKYVGLGIDVIASLVVLTLLFAMLYRTLPDAQIEWRTTWVGAFMTAVLFALGKYGLALYFKYASPASAYGAVGSLAAVLIWIYYSSMIFFFGAEFTQVYAKAKGHGVRPSKHARPLLKYDETETPTPSKLEPAEKPERPATDSGAREGIGEAVAEFEPRPEMASAIQSRIPWAGALTIVAGAVISGIGLNRLRKSSPGFARDVDAARLHWRLRRVEEDLRHVSELSSCLNDREFQSRVARAERRVRMAASRPSLGKSSSSWMDSIRGVIRQTLDK